MLGPVQERALIRRDRLGHLIEALQPLGFAKHRFRIVCHAHLGATSPWNSGQYLNGPC